MHPLITHAAFCVAIAALVFVLLKRKLLVITHVPPTRKARIAASLLMLFAVPFLRRWLLR